MNEKAIAYNTSTITESSDFIIETFSTTKAIVTTLHSQSETHDEIVHEIMCNRTIPNGSMVGARVLTTTTTNIRRRK